MFFENLTLAHGQTLSKVMRNKVCRWGFSGKSGMVLSDHIKQRMVERQVNLEELMLCVMLGKFAGFETPEENEIKFRFYGVGSDGELLAVIIAVSVKEKNPEKWVFTLVTIFSTNNTKEEAIKLLLLFFTAFLKRVKILLCWLPYGFCFRLCRL